MSNTQGITLWQGDCLERMGEIADRSIDLILCDLPFGSTECRWDQAIPLEPLWTHYRRLLKPRGAVVLTASQPFTSMLVMSNREWFRYEWIWDKSFGSNFQMANFQPLKVHESLLVFSSSPATHTKRGEPMAYNPQRGIRSPLLRRPYPKRGGQMPRIRNRVCAPGENWDQDTTFPTSILRYNASAGECNSSSRLHNSQKPILLFEYLIRTYSNEGETVLDNCMGSGTTALACLNTKRRFIGIEKDPVIFEIAARRVERPHAPVIRQEVEPIGPLFAGMEE